MADLYSSLTSSNLRVLLVELHGVVKWTSSSADVVVEDRDSCAFLLHESWEVMPSREFDLILR